MYRHDQGKQEQDKMRLHFEMHQEIEKSFNFIGAVKTVCGSLSVSRDDDDSSIFGTNEVMYHRDQPDDQLSLPSFVRSDTIDGCQISTLDKRHVEKQMKPCHSRTLSLPFTDNLTAVCKERISITHSKPPRYVNKQQHSHRRTASLPTSFASKNNLEDNASLKAHQRECLHRRESFSDENEDDVNLFNQVGTMYFKCNNYKTAYYYFTLALMAIGDYSQLEKTAITLQNTGATQWKLGQLEEAVTSFRNALRMRRNMQSPTSQHELIEVAQSYQNFGLALVLVGNRSNEAMTAFEQAYQIYQTAAKHKHHPKNDNSSEITRSIFFMGNVIVKLGAATANPCYYNRIALNYQHFALQLCYNTTPSCTYVEQTGCEQEHNARFEAIVAVNKHMTAKSTGLQMKLDQRIFR